MVNGYKAEDIFFDLLKKESKDVRKSTTYENMFEHFDFVADEVKYDVKTQKKLNRWDNKPSDIIWIEFTNVRGNKGWIYGKADKIAFLQDDRFIIVDRKKLGEFAYSFILGEMKPLKYKKYRYLYSRSNRSDLLMYIYSSDIKHLIEREILL